jgi:malic enzyme
MQFLQLQWDLNAAAAAATAEFSTDMMSIKLQPLTPKTDAYEVAHAVTKQELQRIVDAELADSSSDEQHAVLKVIEAVCWFTVDDHPLTSAPSQAEIEAALYSATG